MSKENSEIVKNGIFKKALEVYGIEKQSIVAMEELAELQKEISKATRDKFDYEHMAEEIADVYIMIEQMKIYYKISDEDIEKIKEQKIAKLEHTTMFDYFFSDQYVDDFENEEE